MQIILDYDYNVNNTLFYNIGVLMAPTYVKALLEAQNHYCSYCHHTMITHAKKQISRNQATKDHIKPRCHGGQTTVDNLVMACAQCNQIRGAMDAEVFYELLWHWFKLDKTLHKRWHLISRTEFAQKKKECTRIHRVQWQRRLKRCVAATSLHQHVPLPFLKWNARSRSNQACFFA